jgi:short-subunit dehydrogenase
MNGAVGRPAVVVTGASSGIGRELARLAAADGHSLLLVGRDEGALNDLVAELSSRGNRAVGLALDLKQPDAVLRIAESLQREALYCEILINSAGFGTYGAVAETDPELQLTLIDVNIRAVTSLITRFLPGMVERGKGGIINIGSITGYAPGPYMAGYCASKAFIRSLTAALAAEVAGTGVRVMCLTPGVVRTAFFERAPMNRPRNRLLKILPRGDAAATAKIGWKAFADGRSIVVPRAIDRFIISICTLLPDRALARFVSWLQRRGTQPQSPGVPR